MRLVFATLYYLLPAYVANMAPVVAQRLEVLPRLSKPIDRGYKWFGEYLFGSNKTWRGVFVGVAGALLTGYAQFFFWQFNAVRDDFLDFGRIDPLWFGLIGGIGAIAGDLLKSFAKRRFRIKSGQPWPIFDQLDFLIGYLVLTAPLVRLNRNVVIMSIVLTLILQPITNALAYFIKLKKVWW